MTTHAYSEDQLVEQPAIGLFAELGWPTVSAQDEIFGLGKAPNQIPVIVVEPVSGAMPRTESEKGKFIRELLGLGKGKDFTSRISHFLFHPSFPVDIRHNAKIFREKLALWAESQGDK